MKIIPGDTEALYELLSAPEVMRYPEPPFRRMQAEEFLRNAGLSEEPLIDAVDDEKSVYIGYVIDHPMKTVQRKSVGIEKGTLGKRLRQSVRCPSDGTRHEPREISGH